MALLSLLYTLSLLSIELAPASNGYWFDPPCPSFLPGSRRRPVSPRRAWPCFSALDAYLWLLHEAIARAPLSPLIHLLSREVASRCVCAAASHPRKAVDERSRVRWHGERVPHPALAGDLAGAALARSQLDH